MRKYREVMPENPVKSRDFEKGLIFLRLENPTKTQHDFLFEKWTLLIGSRLERFRFPSDLSYLCPLYFFSDGHFGQPLRYKTL